MKTKILLTALSMLFCFQLTQAQYLVDATPIAYRTAFSVKSILNYEGYDTSPMDLNAVASYKISYNTIDVHGNPTVASGAIYIPQVDCDSIPLVSWQHGTVFEKSAVPSNNTELAPALLYSGNGYITTLPDYLGLGDNPGVHPYVHWESEATASIDLIRAAREFLNDSLQIHDNDQLFLAGYSQGGHSTMALHKYISVNNLQSEFNVIASAPMSGPYPLYNVQMRGMLIDDTIFAESAYLPLALASYQLVYENLYDNFNEYYDPPYDSIIADWLASGIHDPYEWFDLIPENFYDFMQDSVLDNIKNDPDHPVNMDLRENDMHNCVPEEPVRMLYCGIDITVFPENSTMARDTMQALGAGDVQALDLYPEGNHNSCFMPTTAYALDWFDSLREPCVVTSIPAVKTQAEIVLYPNPVQEMATFSSNEIAAYELYDMAGALILSRNGVKVDLSGMKAGVYIVFGFDKYGYPLYKGKIIKQ